MLEVFKRRWKPKRQIDMRLPDEHPKKQIYEESVVGKSEMGASSSAVVAPVCDPKSVAAGVNNGAVAARMAANIRVQEGRIEFVDGVVNKNGITPSNGCNSFNNSESQQMQQFHYYRRLQQPPNHYPRKQSKEEKIDNSTKEYLKSRVSDLEKALESERKISQREKLTAARLRRQLSKKESLQRDVDREKRLRTESETRLRNSELDMERCRAKLAVLQREFVRMEETLRSTLQYKTKYEQVKREKASLSLACENHIHHYQNVIERMKDEHEELNKQLHACNLSSADLERAMAQRLQMLEEENGRLLQEEQDQRKRYEKCLDEVSNRVVKAQLAQKNLEDECEELRCRIKQLETCNKVLSALLLQSYSSGSTAGGDSSSTCSSMAAFPCFQSSSSDGGGKWRCSKRPASLDDGRICQLWDEDGFAGGSSSIIWTMPFERPHSLNLECSFQELCPNVDKRSVTGAEAVVEKEERGEGEGEEGEESSPESGNRDEGYSTMSSDVQCNMGASGDMQHSQHIVLADLTEEVTSADEMECCNINRNAGISVSGGSLTPMRLSLEFATSCRNSYPPLHSLWPYHQIMRSLSDSQLSLKIAASWRAALDDEASFYTSSSSSEDGSSLQWRWFRLEDRGRRCSLPHLVAYDSAELEYWTMEGRKEELEAPASPTHFDSWSSGSSRRSASSLDASVGTDFTRDFYRLVKFESNKSLASCSSCDCEGTMPPDREQALQNVLKFIAEQKQHRMIQEGETRTPFKGKETCQGLDEGLFGTCDNCFGKLEGCGSICVKCCDAIDCLPEDAVFGPVKFSPVSRRPLPTVPEEQEEGESGVGKEEVLSDKTSKDVMEELNRMIYMGEGDGASLRSEEEANSLGDGSATGWIPIRMEEDIDFTDPKARANLLDVMLASSSSSSSCGGDGDDSSRDSDCDPRDYRKLHKLHHFRRQKRASTGQMGALRLSLLSGRASILGHKDFFTRYGRAEMEAIASFDFLEDITTTSNSDETATEECENN